jgi:hypothetical protein
LPSGQTRERELERLEILDSEKGVFGLFLKDLLQKYAHIVVALDSNSDPIETYHDDDKDDRANSNVWTEFHKIGFKSIWDSFYDQNTVNKRDNKFSRPVTVNKIRGPLSNQTSKIGIHSHELIDHIFYKGFNFNDNESDGLNGFVLKPKSFLNEEEALNNLIPNKSEPSDHYPVLVELIPQTTTNQKNYIWPTYGLPGLDIGFNTYIYIDKDILPKIEINPKYAQYNTIDDFDNNIPQINSPTACYFAINKSDNSFYRDQQDCIIWYYKPNVGVYINANEDYIVSDSLPEFLSRIDIESRIWFATNFCDDKKNIYYSEEELAYINNIIRNN